MSVTSVNLFSLATSLPYADQVESYYNTANSSIQFLSYNSSFENDILGPQVSSKLLSNETWEAWHEGYALYNDAVYAASNYQSLDNPINITIYNLTTSDFTSTRYEGLYMSNGLTNFKAPPNASPDTINLTPNKTYLLVADEGDFQHPSGLIAVDPETNKTTPIITSFMGRNFSSVNDLKQHSSTGDVWFTDAQYGFTQYFRPDPVIPPQVYRFSPSTGVVQAVADGFFEPNGFEFSPDEKTAYVTDTGANRFGYNATLPATIYAYDMVDEMYLRNRRIFAYSDVGIPDGIHCDKDGNVYASCKDGIHVWNDRGVLLGKMIVEGGSNNFAFVPGGLLLFNGYKMWQVTIKAVGRELAG